jgi:hypothetical protein
VVLAATAAAEYPGKVHFHDLGYPQSFVIIIAHDMRTMNRLTIDLLLDQQTDKSSIHTIDLKP